MEDRKGFCRKTAAVGAIAGCKDPVLRLGDAPAMLIYTPRSNRAGGPGWVAAPRHAQSVAPSAEPGLELSQERSDSLHGAGSNFWDGCEASSLPEAREGGHPPHRGVMLHREPLRRAGGGSGFKKSRG